MDEQYPDEIRERRDAAALLNKAAIARKHGWTDLAAELEQRAAQPETQEPKK